jgi:hypothetical protein
MPDATISMLKPNDNTLSINVSQRISREVTWTSDTWDDMATTRASYKNQNSPDPAARELQPAAIRLLTLRPLVVAVGVAKGEDRPGEQPGAGQCGHKQAHVHRPLKRRQLASLRKRPSQSAAAAAKPRR